MQQFDLIVIGGGRASSIAFKAAKLGKKVALIEKALLGGTCANNGCVPSKLLVGYSEAARAIKNSSKHYIHSTIDKIDREKIFAKNKEYIESVDPNYLKKLNENITFFRAKASFVSDKVVAVKGKELTAKDIVIATGTSPKKPAVKGAWTSEDIFPLQKIPSSITVVGGGFIACELANVFQSLGIKTTVVARGTALMESEDIDIANSFTQNFSKNVEVLLSTTLKDAVYENGHFAITLQNQDKTLSSRKSQALLYATGRESNAKDLNLENTSIEVDENGFIKRDRNFQTAVEGVYVVGDAAGEYLLQHAAAKEVDHLYKMLYEDEKSPLEFKYMPHAVFSDPEIASVGLSEEDAKQRGYEFVSVKTDWKASAKAQSMKLDYPFTKFIVEKKSYKILGCHMIGPQSSTMIHQVLTVMHIDNDIRHLKQMLYIHPALSETLLPAAIKVIKAIEKR